MSFEIREQDPHKAIDGIFVCVIDNKIVSSVRVYHRSIYVNGEEWKMGGIGEVSTAIEYRRKGIATLLLKMAIEYMEKNNMVISVLSARKQVESLYSALGWQFIPYYTCHTKIDYIEDLGMSLKKESYRNLSEQDKLQLRNIYAQTSRRFSGPLVRTNEYWDTWVVGESKSAWIITLNNSVVGYFSLNDEEENYLSVKEFIISDEFFPKIKNIFEWALATVIKNINKPEAVVSYYSALGSFGKIFEEKLHDNQMYKLLSGCPESLENAFKLFKESGRKHHLFWETDHW